jgi:hypothetical protein
MYPAESRVCGGNAYTSVLLDCRGRRKKRWEWQPSSLLTRVTSPSYIVQRSSEASGVQGPLTSTTVEQHRSAQSHQCSPCCGRLCILWYRTFTPSQAPPTESCVSLVVLVHSPPSPSLRATLNRVRRAAAHPTRCWCRCDAAHRYAWWCRLSLRWEARGRAFAAALCSGHSLCGGCIYDIVQPVYMARGSSRGEGE